MDKTALGHKEERIVLCVDMDAFFASVEQKTNPKLRGKPIAVIGSGARTVITTSSYEARQYGVKTGMNVWEAKQLCPRITFVVGNNARYTHTCSELTKLYERYTPELEIYSIDEAFLDITDSHHLFGGPMEIGRQIKDEITRIFGIGCTVGIGPNILIAKLVSDLAKPDGLKRVLEAEVPGFIEGLEVQELWGIGRKTSAKLAALGIRTCGELGKTPVSLLRNKFGLQGEALKAIGLGQCHRPVIRGLDEEVKSVGHSMTLPADIWERREMEAYLLKLSERVGRRARLHGLMGRKVSLVLRYSDFETLSRQATLPDYTNDTHMIYKSVLNILEGLMPLKSSIRLLGVTLCSVLEDPGQMALLQEERKRKAVLGAMDHINDRYGDGKLAWAAYAMQGSERGVISPSWRPSGARHVQLK